MVAVTAMIAIMLVMVTVIWLRTKSAEDESVRKKKEKIDKQVLETMRKTRKQPEVKSLSKKKKPEEPKEDDVPRWKQEPKE
jgi:Flp pilus assembly protein TadB